MKSEYEFKKESHIFSKAKDGVNFGYSKQFNFIYDKRRIPNKFLRLKEWDFYQITNGRYVLQMNMGHLSYVSNISVTLIDLKEKKKYSISKTRPFHLERKLRMENDGSKEHYLRYDSHGCHMVFDVNSNHERYLSFDGFSNEYKNFDVELKLKEHAPYEASCTHKPFINANGKFFLNYKLNGMTASGIVRINDKEIIFNEKNSFALLDWGRGILDKQTSWIWSNGTQLDANNNIVGFNLGFGIGDDSFGSENMVFKNNVGYKIKGIELSKNAFDELKPFDITDDDARLLLNVIPFYDNYTYSGNSIANMEVHQLFCVFNGFYILDDGSKIEFKDMIAFIECANNKW